MSCTSLGRHIEALGTLALLAGCARSQLEPTTYSLTAVVESDPGVPLAGAAILRENSVLGTTGADGKASLRVRGAEGETLRLELRCPTGHRAPSGWLDVNLRKLDDASKPPSYKLVCQPEQRLLVVAVRASNGPNLPVLYLGKEIGRTDSNGVTHVQVRARPGERFELALDTAQSPKLIPQHPTAVFVAKAEDELLLFEQAFKVPQPKQTRQKAPSGPRSF
ncbi:MAG: hypothetical protein QM756_15960 [Polyangiaceae bacterium]